MENSMIEEPDFNGWAREYDDEEPDIADDFGDVDASAAVDADAAAHAQAEAEAEMAAIAKPLLPIRIPLAEYLASDDVAF
jgi:hypothetical protein